MLFEIQPFDKLRFLELHFLNSFLWLYIIMYQWIIEWNMQKGEFGKNKVSYNRLVLSPRFGLRRRMCFFFTSDVYKNYNL